MSAIEEQLSRMGTDPVDLDQRMAAIRDAAERQGLIDVAYATADSPCGQLLVAATDSGVVRLGLPSLDPDAVLGDLARQVSPRVLEHRARLDPVLSELERYFAGELTSFSVPVDWQLVGGSFGRRVLEATAAIPYGSTLSYAEVAASAGNPRAFRAAGSALGANPIPVIVPCHRILRGGGGLGGYAGGLEMKQTLLELESRYLQG